MYVRRATSGQRRPTRSRRVHGNRRPHAAHHRRPEARCVKCVSGAWAATITAMSERRRGSPPLLDSSAFTSAQTSWAMASASRPGKPGAARSGRAGNRRRGPARRARVRAPGCRAEAGRAGCGAPPRPARRRSGKKRSDCSRSRLDSSGVAPRRATRLASASRSQSCSLSDSSGIRRPSRESLSLPPNGRMVRLRFERGQGARRLPATDHRHPRLRLHRGRRDRSGTRA